MKLKLVNANLEFAMCSVITDTVSKTYSGTGSFTVELNLSKPIAPNTPFKLSCSGDTLFSENWNLYLNKYQDSNYSVVPSTFEETEITVPYTVYNIRLVKATLTSAGTVTLKAKYTELEIEQETLEDTLTETAGVGDLVLTLPEVKSSPFYFIVSSKNFVGQLSEGKNIKIEFLDSNEDIIGTAINYGLSSTKTTCLYNESTPVKYLKFYKTGNITGSVDIKVAYP